MKYVNLLLALVCLAACNDEPTVGSPQEPYRPQSGGYGSNSPSSTPSNTNGSTNGDSAYTREARAALIKEFRKYQAQAIQEAAADPEMQEILKQQLDRVVAKLESTPANSVEALQQIALTAAAEVMDEMMDPAIARLEKDLPARVKPEPLPGEKRDAVEDNGDCSNDLQVDVGRNAILATKTAKKMAAVMKGPNPSDFAAKIRPLALELVTSCLEIVERYGRDAVCSMPEPAKDFSLPEFSEACDDLVERYREIL